MAKPQKEQVQLFFVVVWKLGLVLQKAVSKRVPIRRANRIVGKKWHFLRYIELHVSSAPKQPTMPTYSIIEPTKKLWAK